MSGKVLALGLVLITSIFGALVYYTQVYYYYETVEMSEVRLTVVDGAPEAIIADNISALDGSSSPIRFRACFTTPMSDSMLTETYEVFEGAEPRNAPHWFDCFNSVQIGEDLEAGNATAYTGVRNIEFGIDRVVAIYPDGRGYIWHQINDCGDKLYDGSAASSDCPERN